MWNLLSYTLAVLIASLTSHLDFRVRVLHCKSIFFIHSSNFALGSEPSLFYDTLIYELCIFFVCCCKQTWDDWEYLSSESGVCLAFCSFKQGSVRDS